MNIFCNTFRMCVFKFCIQWFFYKHFHVSGNNQVVRDISNKFSWEISLPEENQEDNFIMLSGLCPMDGLIFLRWKKEFGLLKRIQKVIWNFFHYDTSVCLFKNLINEMDALGELPSPQPIHQPCCLFLFPSLHTHPHSPVLSASTSIF